jgi:transcriptional regulator with XRE-family HTH domain
MVSLNSRTIGRHIRMLWEERGFILRRLARQSGISRSTLSMYEWGRTRRLDARNLERAATALSISVKD